MLDAVVLACVTFVKAIGRIVPPSTLLKIVVVPPSDTTLTFPEVPT